LIGNIGGYVGLLLGVSILQVLALMVQMFGNLMKFCIKKSRQSVIPFPDIAATENGESRSESRLFLRTYESTSKISNERKVSALKNENDVAIFLSEIVDNQI
jgi:hypothetical protein